jgi:hypothetical protein
MIPMMAVKAASSVSQSARGSEVPDWLPGPLPAFGNRGVVPPPGVAVSVPGDPPPTLGVDVRDVAVDVNKVEVSVSLVAVAN